MASVAFDTLKLAQRLEAAGFPPKQAQDMASAIGETIVDTVVTKEYLDLRISEVRLEIANVKADILKWVLGAIGFQTLAVIGGVAALLKLLGQ
ncbi:MAG: DUF1640 domain-containing protein [Alphaproteobacteria bacterium]